MTELAMIEIKIRVDEQHVLTYEMEDSATLQDLRNQISEQFRIGNIDDIKFIFKVPLSNNSTPLTSLRFGPNDEIYCPFLIPYVVKANPNDPNNFKSMVGFLTKLGYPKKIAESTLRSNQYNTITAIQELKENSPKKLSSSEDSFYSTDYDYDDFYSSEDELLYQKFQKYGKNWTKLKTFFPNRSLKTLKYHWHNLRKKIDFEKNPFRETHSNDTWTKSEEQLISTFYETFGPNWHFLVDNLKKRSAIDIAIHYDKMQQEEKKQIESLQNSKNGYHVHNERPPILPSYSDTKRPEPISVSSSTYETESSTTTSSYYSRRSSSYTSSTSSTYQSSTENASSTESNEVTESENSTSSSSTSTSTSSSLSSNSYPKKRHCFRKPDTYRPKRKIVYDRIYDADDDDNDNDDDDDNDEDYIPNRYRETDRRGHIRRRRRLPKSFLESIKLPPQWLNKNKEKEQEIIETQEKEPEILDEIEEEQEIEDGGWSQNDDRLLVEYKEQFMLTFHQIHDQMSNKSLDEIMDRYHYLKSMQEGTNISNLQIPRRHKRSVFEVSDDRRNQFPSLQRMRDESQENTVSDEIDNTESPIPPEPTESQNTSSSTELVQEEPEIPNKTAKVPTNDEGSDNEINSEVPFLPILIDSTSDSDKEESNEAAKNVSNDSNSDEDRYDWIIRSKLEAGKSLSDISAFLGFKLTRQQIMDRWVAEIYKHYATEYRNEIYQRILEELCSCSDEENLVKNSDNEDEGE